jgi:hypothetical protein
MIAGVVVEGKRDFPIFEAIIREICPAVEKVQRIHPRSDELSTGSTGGVRETGWTGVRHWCQRYGPILTRFMHDYGEPLDLLVIQIDASIARRPGIGLERPCPPASDTTDALRELVRQWIGERVPDNVIVAIPSKTTDAWVCASFVGGDDLLECDPEPLEHLANVGNLGFRLKQTSDGTVKKPSAKRYEIHLAPQVAACFDQVRNVCGEAERFALDVETRCMLGEMETDR